MQVFWYDGMTLADLEKEVIEASMLKHSGDKNIVAKTLDIALRTVDNKLKKYAEDKAKLTSHLDKEEEERRNEINKIKQDRGHDETTNITNDQRDA